MNAKNFFDKAALQTIKAAIRKAEQGTTGEIRVHLANQTETNVLEQAWLIFGKLNMHKTKNRNGVLIYISVKDHKLAIVGDEGINQITPDNFWETELSHMQTAFKAENYLSGLKACIKDVGEKLKTHFPKRGKAENELPNDVSFDE